MTEAEFNSLVRTNHKLCDRASWLYAHEKGRNRGVEERRRINEKVKEWERLRQKLCVFGD
jgi:hypothetical protein